MAPAALIAVGCWLRLYTTSTSQAAGVATEVPAVGEANGSRNCSVKCPCHEIGVLLAPDWTDSERMGWGLSWIQGSGGVALPDGELSKTTETGKAATGANTKRFSRASALNRR